MHVGSRVAALLTGVLLVATACSSGGHDTASSTTTTHPVSTTAPTTSTTAFVGATTATSIAGTATHTALLQAVRVAGQPGFDRVVLELSGAASPEVDARYVDQPRADGSGAAVAVAGQAYLQLRLQPASGVDLTGEQAKPTYRGASRVRGDTRAITEVVRTGDFEGYLTWVIGVRARAPFRVRTLADPTRIVVDVAAP